MQDNNQSSDTTRQELALLGSKKENMATLDLMFQAFLESPLADCRDRRTEVLSLHRVIKQLL